MPDGTGPQGAVSLSDIQDRVSFIEQVAADLSPQDEYLQAIAQNQALLLQMMGQQGTMTGEVTDDTQREGGPLTDIESSRLPEDATGTVARDINPGDTGPAIFQLNGSVFYTIVQNTDREEMQAGTAVRVVGPRNRVTARGAAANIAGAGAGAGGRGFRYQGRLYLVPNVTEGEQDVKVANQLYNRGNYSAVSATLQPGGELEVARIEPDANEFLLLKHTNATAHDTVEYEYYIDNNQEPDPDLSGPSPWATPPDLYSVSPDGFRLVEDFVSLKLVETSGSNSYDTYQGTLTGILVEVKA